MLAAVPWVFEPKRICRRPFYQQSRKAQTLRQKVYPKHIPVRHNINHSEADATDTGDLDDIVRQRHVKRNELGVQLLSRGLHRQIFKSSPFPAPPSSYVQISKEHLSLHGLDPSQGSKLPDISFQLPPLQGANISEHFHSIGMHAAEPWLSLAKSYATRHIPPKPDCWHIQSGWTKYYYSPDGSGYSEHVEAPCHDGKPETMLTFDVETMPKYHPHPVMACAASQHAWYAWISPWLLGESDDPQYFIPLGNPSVPKIVVGHNVSYDRIRVSDEYDVHDNANRFIDTMSLHIAVSGISSHQRPAWTKYRKAKILEEEQQEEAVEVILGYMKSVKDREQTETDSAKRQELRKVYQDMEDSLLQLQTQNASNSSRSEGEEAAAEAAKRWEDITAANSLRDVAKLHCNIDLDKDIRNDLISAELNYVRDNLIDFLDYCALDVQTTFQVYSVTLPAFLSACPHPVSFAGMLTMGSPFLTVDGNWEEYLRKADAVYHEMEDKVEAKLKRLAEEARDLMKDGQERWKSDPWLSQLDWTPKVASKSRGVVPSNEGTSESVAKGPENVAEPNIDGHALPKWYLNLTRNTFGDASMDRILPLLLRYTYEGQPLRYDKEDGWYTTMSSKKRLIELVKGRKTRRILSKSAIKYFNNGKFGSCNQELTRALCCGERGNDVLEQILALGNQATQLTPSEWQSDPWLSQLDWVLSEEASTSKVRAVKKPKPPKPPQVTWPKWYWDAAAPKKDLPPGTLQVTVRTRIAPLLLRLSWSGHPLIYSREHGWTFRVPANSNFQTRTKPVKFYDPADSALSEAVLSGGYNFYKLPHKDGEEANVANPLGKTFIKYVQDGTLKSPGSEAKEALDLNSLCSYWVSARDRILNQLVVWQKSDRSLGLPDPGPGREKYGIILPQVIAMGTVTRRAIEKTWLTASNAKPNRVGSELKAMVRAPEGYAIVGADVDSEELWISSCMGDAQFGLHGASAIGWMTLEGTKSAGTDLHSKTAGILGISRDQAKVFNYSRIYGAGMRHAVLLLLQSNSTMRAEEAQKLAESLYASTKGKNTHRTDLFGRKFWYGGTESFLFNKLEEIALSDRPQTPALGCGVTHALSKEYLPEGFGTDYLPSRINWVVQSSGVDYLHMLIVAMSHLIEKYDIQARYLISVHDELRYLVVEEDKYRAALALQIANLWTRCMFAFKLGMDDLPQGVAFFSAVDVDHVLRKEVYMPCVTPSQPIPIPPGESLEISKVLEKTNGGTLRKDGLPMYEGRNKRDAPILESHIQSNYLAHRAKSAAWLKAQTSIDFGEVKGLAEQVAGAKYADKAVNKKPGPKFLKKAPLGNGDGVDWSEIVERLLIS